MRDQTLAELCGRVRTAGSLVNRRQAVRAVLVMAILGAVLYQALAYLRAVDSAGGDEETVTLLIADRYIPAFSLVKPEWVRLCQYPRNFVPPGSLHQAKDLYSADGNARYISAVPIPRGQTLSTTLLLDAGRGKGLAALLRPGKVAVSIAVDSVRSVGGWVQPGDTIALFQTPENSKGKAGESRPVFRALTVLAVDKTRIGAAAPALPDNDPAALLAAAEQTGTTITVLTNMVDAARLIAAADQGHLTAVLRAWADELEDSHGG
jgi:Flp pilus assembly protein CpaB